MKKKNIKNRFGFTLIEIMVALTIAATFFGYFSYLILDGLDKRKEARELNLAVFLAKQKMDEIKSLRKADEQSGTFENFNKDYSFHYIIEDIEVDLMELAGEVEGDTEDKTKQYLEEHGKTNETQTGAIFKMLHYKVTIKYRHDKKQFSVEFYRGKSFKL